MANNPPLEEKLRAAGMAEPGPECLGDEVLAELLVRENSAALDHALGCDWCGRRLALAANLHAAERERAESGPEAEPGVIALPARRRHLVRWAAAAAVLVAAGLAWMRPWAPSAGELLLQAYEAQRPFEFRLEGAAPVPVRVQRSDRADAPAALLDAEARVARGATDAERGRLALLQGKWARAVELLRGAPASRLDLAIALAQQGQYQEALAYLDGATAAARFNRALVLEKSGQMAEARQAWEQVLRQEPEAGWAAEARAHLARLPR